MTTTFKEGTNGFYCAECRMSFSEPQATCPYCGSLVTNYEELLTNSIVNTFIDDITSSPPPQEIRGLRRKTGIIEDSPMIDSEMYKKIQTFLKERACSNESNIS